ncbi:RHS repeat protein [Lysobacter tyrosinilyticus]
MHWNLMGGGCGLRSRSCVSAGNFAKKLKRFASLSVLLTAVLAASAVQAQTNRSIAEGYDDVLKTAQTIGTLGPDLFGEQVNLQDGATAFRATDVSVKTNSGLPMSVGRVLSISARDADSYGDAAHDGELFGMWKLDVPYMSGVFDERTGWVSSMPDPQQRCSVTDLAYMLPPGVRSVYTNWPDSYYAYQYWSGNRINIPGHGEEPLLYLPAGKSRPTDGRVYYGTTKSNWRVACLPSLKNGAGEGFLVVLPDGTRYTFDWMSSRKVGSLKDTQCVETYYNEYSGSYTPVTVTYHYNEILQIWVKRFEGGGGGVSGGTRVSTSCSEQVVVNRREYFLHATKVEDRFGNWVAYQFDPNNPRQLMSITSNEGASINLTYVAGRVDTITTNGRTWRYLYTDAERGILSGVVLPDDSPASPSRWGFSYGDLNKLTRNSIKWVDCSPALFGTSPASVVISHPSGAVGTFAFERRMHGTEDTPGGCYTPDPEKPMRNELSDIIAVYQVASLITKTITGPGLPAQSWSYTYQPSWSWNESGTNPCGSPASCQSTSLTSVTGPDNVITRYSFSNSYWTNPGELMQTTVEKDGVIAQTTNNAYFVNPAGQPHPFRVGEDPYSRANLNVTEYLHPKQSSVINSDGVNFNWLVTQFDSFARPLTVNKSSSLGYTKAEGTEYYDDSNKWVRDQIKRSTTNGVETARADYIAANALPERYYSFGKLVQTLTYNTDGTLATAADGKNQVTTLSSWKRGIPGLISHPDGTTDSAVIDNNGWVTSATDENTYTTGYGYDAMGRVTSIVPPEGNATARTYTAVGTAEQGLSAGHWRVVETTGNAKKITYLDGFWRPVAQQSEDVANSSGTLSWTATRYDLSGPVAFVSYPRNPYVEGWLNFDDTSLKGTRSTYDILGRVKRVEQDSEFGSLVTTTEYLTGFQRRITNPRGFATTQKFEVYDQPSFDMPSSIDAPLGSKTLITRDMFGKPTSVTRTGPDY